MNFAALSGLWLGLIALPVIALYILKIKRHQRVVPYLRLWEKLLAEQRFSSLFHRLQRILSLLLQIAIAACLVGAFAMMTLSDSFLKEESVVLVIDTSASMQGLEKKDSTKTRFAAALERAKDLVEGRSAEDEYAILAAGAEPEVLQGFSRSTLRLREALSALKPTRASGDLEAAHRLAKDLLQGKKHPRVLLLSDAAGGSAEQILKSDPDARWLRVGESVPNLGIVRFQARKNHAVGTDYLLMAVTNFSDQKRTANLEIALEGATRKVIPLELAPGEEHSEVMELDLPEGGFAKATLVHPQAADGKPGHDALDLDDVAWAAVPPARLYKVLLVAAAPEQEPPFKAAFSALSGLVDPKQSRVATLEEWQKESESFAKAFDLVLFVNTAPTSLPSEGCYLAINALPGGLPCKELGLEKGPQIKDVDAAHPMNRFLEAKSMQPATAKPLDLTGGSPFLSTGAGPVGVVFQNLQRKVVYLGLDVLSDLFFLQVAFPIVLRNALAWMHEEESELIEPNYAPGAVIRPRFTLADKAVELMWLHEWTRQKGNATIALRDGRFFWADTWEPGRYAFRTAKGDYRTTVNLFDKRESDLTMPKPPEKQTDSDIERAGFLFGKDIWPALLLLAAFLSLCEWGLFHRRITE